MQRIGFLVLVAAATGCGQSSADSAIVLPANTVLLEAASDADNFRFPADKAGGLLAQLLQPAQSLPGALSDTPSSQKTLAGGRGLEQPQLPLSPGPAELPRRKLEPTPPAVRPRAVAEAAPLAGYRDDPVAPARPLLASGAPIALPSVDVHQPVPLPALNLLVPDRVPLDDPSAAASRQTALAAPPPVRVNPVPFAPENLPDPFVHAQTVRLRLPPPENPQPRP